MADIRSRETSPTNLTLGAAENSVLAKEELEEAWRSLHYRLGLRERRSCFPTPRGTNGHVPEGDA